VQPCRAVDTRGPNGPLSGPMLAAGTSRAFPIPAGPCGVPLRARAYSLNATVLPSGPLPYLTLWPDGQLQPIASTLNALDGSITSNAALLSAGPSGGIRAFAAGNTHLLLDVNGYFDTPANYIPLPAPLPISPNNAIFSGFPRRTTLNWTNVAGATSYGVEVQYCQSPGARNCSAWINTTTSTPTYTFDFIGAQSGRWRVWARDATGRVSAVSEWRVFEYTQ
jgi:hypothetical protein